MVSRGRQKRGRFVYQPRDEEDVKRRAKQSGGMYDSLFLPTFQTFSTAKEGDYSIRVMPPTWKNAKHYGYDIYVHYGVGSDNQKYLCPQKMKGEKCPICEDRIVAGKEGDTDYAQSLTPTKRVLMWVIDRNSKENTGPQLYDMPQTLDGDFIDLSRDKHTGKYLVLDHQEEGYDFDFTKKGQKRIVKYTGVAIVRRSSPLSDDSELMLEWLQFITENPIPETLQFFDYDHIAATHAGGSRDESDKDEDEPPSRKSKSRSRDEDEDEDEPSRSRTKTRSRLHDEDDDEDEPPPRKSKPRSRDEDDDEPPFDEDDEDEDDLPPRRKPKSSSRDEKKKPSDTRSRSRDEDDDEDDEDEDEDED